MSEVKHVKLVEKFEKEGQDNVSLAKKNAPILKSKMEAKVKALEAQELEAQAYLQEAEEVVEQAIAYVTKDVDVWISKVRSAEENRDTYSLRLESIGRSIEWHKDQISLF